MSNEKFEELITEFSEGKFTRKEFIQKSIVLGISMSTIGAFLAACGVKPSETNKGGQASSSKAEVISVLVATDKPWVPDYCKTFEQQTGITVNLITVDYNSISTKFVAAAAGGVAAYDVVESEPKMSNSWIQAGYLEPLDNLISKYKSDLVNPGLLSFQGKIYGMPWFVDALFFLYNKEILGKAGFDRPPETWDDFVNQCQVLQKKSILQYPITLFWKQIEGEACLYEIVLEEFGGHLFDEKLTKPTFNSPEGVAALQFLTDLNLKYKLVSPGSFSSNPLMATTELCQGRSAYAITWGALTGMVSDPAKSKVIGKIEAALIPKKQRSVTVEGSETLSITKASKHKEAAWKFIEGLTSKDYEKKICIGQKTLPVWKSLYNDQEINAKNTFMKTFGEQLKDIYTRPVKKWYNEFSQILQVATISALSGKVGAKAALDDAAKQTEALLAKS